MPITALLLALAPQSVGIPLETPADEDDSPFLAAAAFTPDGSTLLLPHWSPSIVELDVPSRTAIGSTRLDDDVHLAAVSPDGTRVVLERPFNRLTVHAYPGFAQLAELDYVSNGVHRLVMDRSGTRVLAVQSGGLVQVFDLSTGDRLQSFSTPGAIAPDGGLQSGLAADDRTFVTAGFQRIRAFDVTTGQPTTSFAFGPNRRARQISINTAGTRAHVLVRDRTSGTDRIDVDLFDLPSLTRISTTATGIVGTDLVPATVFSVDAAGARAVVADPAGVFALDLATGATTVLSSAAAPFSTNSQTAAISPDGRTAAAIVEGEMVLFDTATGQALGARVLQSPLTSFEALVRHPRLPLFVVENGADRLEIAERPPAGPVRFDDINSGLGPESDGAIDPLELRDGRHVAVAHSGSDEVVFVDVDAGSVAGRVDVEREPVAVAEVSGGLLVVAHGRASSGVVIDTTTLAVTGRFDLSGRATAIAGVPGTTTAWVHVSEPGLRALELVDASSTVILATVPLVAATSLTVRQPDVVFDVPNGLAVTVDAQAGSITVVDLTGATVIGSAAFTAGAAAQAFVAPDGSRVSVVSSNATAESWLVTPTALVPDWTYSCVANPAGRQSSASGALSPDGSRLVAVMPNGQFPTPPGTCPWVVALDTQTGQVVSTSTNNGWFLTQPVDGGVERLRRSSLGVDQYRFEGDGFVYAGSFDGGASYVLGDFQRGDVSARTYAIGRVWSRAQGYGNVLAVLDPLEARRDVECDPAVPNATGAPAALEIEGGGLANGRLAARVSGLEPGGMFGFLLVADTLTTPMPAVGSQGLLCLGGALGRYVDQVQPADVAGVQRYDIVLDALPLSAGPTAAQPGETWSFQSWYRDLDAIGAATSNFSSAVAVEIR